MGAETVRVAAVGLGLAAAAHAKGYASHPSAQLVAVCDLDRQRAEEFAARQGVAAVYTEYERLLEREDIALVDITTPTYLHAPMCLAALRAGKHVQCEKPFCRSLAEGQEVVELARQRRRKVAVGETYVFHTSHLKARALIEAGAIGRPLQIRQRHGAWLERQSAAIDTGPAGRNWRLDRQESGGGDYPWIFDHAVHFFAAAEYFALDQPIAEVYSVASQAAVGTGQSGASHDPYTAAEVDIPLITFKFADPACQGVWMRAERLNGKYDYMRGFSTTIVGEEGMIEVLGEGGGNLWWQGEQQHLVLHRQGGPSRAYRFDEGGDDVWQSEICYYSQGHINQVHNLVDAIIADQAPRYSAAAGVRAVGCTLAAIQSAQKGTPVLVDQVAPDYTAYGAQSA